MWLIERNSIPECTRCVRGQGGPTCFVLSVPNMVPKIDKIVNFQFNYYMMDARKDLRRDPIDIWLKSAFSLVHHT